MIQINYDKHDNIYCVIELELDRESWNYEIVGWEWVSEDKIAEMFSDWEAEVGMSEAEEYGCVDEREVEQYTENKIDGWWKDLNDGKKVEMYW